MNPRKPCFVVYFYCITGLEEQLLLMAGAVFSESLALLPFKYSNESNQNVQWNDFQSPFSSYIAKLYIVHVTIAQSVTICLCTYVFAFSCLLQQCRGSGYLTILWRHLKNVRQLWNQPSIWACQQRKVQGCGALTCSTWSSKGQILINFRRLPT